jgi:hypothetical protein
VWVLCCRCSNRYSLPDGPPGARCLPQECKALNKRLTDFLKQKTSVAALLTYITEPADLDAEPKRQFKYPYTACEVRWIAQPARNVR